MAKKKVNRKKQLKKQLADLKRAGRVGLERAAEVVETVAHKAEAVVERAYCGTSERSCSRGDFFSDFIGRLFGAS